ncbi:vacuolar-sorting protein SNF8 [Thecamonas trahens ATCC 50062]|uniref:Vacuolar-sorting protein SNF8 n=1 Tax=Thecamonas trahens ATCC 50062 TaxID=461836 RepID=A0A0L0DBG7_THETB|nr:vacuolar-sorting protein SNF8 [Thecamonas trahens ATCC 50062]KNC48638.1 vacuolar-sorting protein SNF8 [Thecamonas trahens ATCC 50062]|eukprot:XP_013762694.1 vacuolar-sorting protein SNF8 [Thecamonas trahens ATCC 50062]
MRRRGGIGGIQRRQQQKKRFEDVGASVEEAKVQNVREQLEVFQSSLASFAAQYKSDINRNPAFRMHFQRMCADIGVDTLQSESRSGQSSSASVTFTTSSASRSSTSASPPAPQTAASSSWTSSSAVFRPAAPPPPRKSLRTTSSAPSRSCASLATATPSSTSVHPSSSNRSRASSTSTTPPSCSLPRTRPRSRAPPSRMPSPGPTTASLPSSIYLSRRAWPGSTSRGRSRRTGSLRSGTIDATDNRWMRSIAPRVTPV